MNYMKRLERLWKLQEILGNELRAGEDTLSENEADILVDKIIRLQNMTEKA